MATTIENLPNEVLSEIFIRLLSKQLAQMRCVCKPWNALLSKSSFIKSHLHRSIQNKYEILLISHSEFPCECSLFTARPYDSPNLELTNLIKLPVNLPREYTVIGSVNGLICFYYKSSLDDYVVHIWNPSLSALLTLPEFSMASNEPGFRFGFGIGFGFGFGFDPTTDDYKVVKIAKLSEPPNMMLQAEVYSVRKGSWTLVSQRFPTHIKLRDKNRVCVDDHNGHLHWLCDTVLEGKPETILAFDLGAETFSEIPLPDSIKVYNVHHFHSVLGVLGGKLCVMSYGVISAKCEVWVMDEYGVAESWVKHHAFSMLSGGKFPFGFTLRGEVIFRFQKYENRFALYDPVASTTKTFENMSRNSLMCKVVEYVDSLVWIEPANRLQI